MSRFTAVGGGSVAIETSLPPSLSTVGEPSSRSPPAVSKTRLTGSTASSMRMAVWSITSVRAELADGVEARRRGGGDHVGAAGGRELDRERPDAAGTPVDQHALSRLQLAMIEEALPSAEAGEGGARRSRRGRGFAALGARTSSGNTASSAAAPSRSKPESA
jgi:hypothetical protein